jgi:serine phosphatase RsbU (regulator of sigma subunit)/PAS domain-containing protein
MAHNGTHGLTERHAALRQAAAMPDADPRAILEAAFAELDAAIDLLASAGPDADSQPDAGDGDQAPPDTLSSERRLLRAVFQRAPIPLFVLEQDGTVRRANAAAGDLVGSSPGYVTGRPLTTFVDLPSRAVVQSQLAAIVRTGAPRQAACKVLGPDGPAGAVLTAGPFELPDGQRLLAAALIPAALIPAALAPAGRGAAKRAAKDEPAARDEPAPDALRAMTRRMDTVTAVTRLLLDNSTFNEAVTLQRCARLLAGDLASWVIVDMERTGRLRRHLVIGPSDEPAAELARHIRAIDPRPETGPAMVHAAGKSMLLAHVDDSGVLGADPDGAPLLALLGATSMLTVPITDGSTGYGSLTLVRRPDQERFGIADLGLAEELGEHLGVAIRVDRMFRHRSAVAEALQASLLPATLPEIPGLDLSAAYLPAGAGLDVSGDFYDVFPVRGGWGLTIGDVCGKGQEAAAMTAAARHAIRVLASFEDDPGVVLAKANEIMLAGGYEDRFVTAKLAYLRWGKRGLRVTLASAGHPGPAVVRADGRVELLAGGGQPLGLFPSAGVPAAEPHLETLWLSAGDLLFFYSDGVTDARNSDQAYFDERLADELAALAGRPAAETARAIQGQLVGFSADELRDDLTILVAKVTGLPGLRGTGQLVPQVGERPVEQAGDVHLGNAEAVADLGLGEVPVEAEHEDALLAFWQFLPVRVERRHVERVLDAGVVVAEHIREQRRVIPVRQRGVQRVRAEHQVRLACLADVVLADMQSSGQFLIRRCAAQLVGEGLAGLAHFKQQFLGLPAHVNLPPLVPEMPLDLAAHARRRVGGQAVADLRVVVVDGLEQSDVADLHEVLGRFRAAAVLAHA